MTTQRAAFVRRVLAHHGERPGYVWGGKTPGALDCSGLVTLSLWEASDGKLDWRQTINTDGLWRLPAVETVAELRNGDLCLYWGEHSTGPEDVSHVMVYFDPGQCLGMAWGGPGDTNAANSRAMGKVSLVRPVNYRADLAGFRRLPLE